MRIGLIIRVRSFLIKGKERELEFTFCTNFKKDAILFGQSFALFLASKEKAADTMLLLADRFLAEGVIDQKTYDLLARKYPIA